MKKQQFNDEPLHPSFYFKQIVPRGLRQKAYMDVINTKDIVFGVGAAGSGKTFLSVACALRALKEKKVSRIIITRPVVEAGEKLGFLPGDLNEKINPYLKPIYDSFFDLIGPDLLNDWRADEIIEIAPLAYLRGRTLNNAFIILDEAQNTTSEQMKMFLTRMGNGSKIMITGDTTQSDLPSKMTSGLGQAIRILKDIEGIEFVYFLQEDVVRHPLVKKVIGAYEEFEKK